MLMYKEEGGKLV